MVDSGLYEWCFSLFSNPMHGIEDADDVMVRRDMRPEDLTAFEWRTKQHNKIHAQANRLLSNPGSTIILTIAITIDIIIK